MGDITQGTQVTGKVILNRSEAASWSRKFITNQGKDLNRRLLANARAEAPFKTGRLRANLKVEPFRMTGPYKGEGGVGVSKKDVPYAGYVMYGTKPHVIRARRAKFLRFYWPKVGRVVFFKKVNHPGTKANRFLERALNRTAREIQ